MFTGLGTGALITHTLPVAAGSNPLSLPVIACYFGDAAQNTWVAVNTNPDLGFTCGIVGITGALSARFAGVSAGMPYQIVVVF